MLSIAGYEWGWDNARALIGIVLITAGVVLVNLRH